MDLSEHSLTSILDSLHDGLYITDTKRRVVYWNAAAEQITGYSAGDVVGTSCSLNVLNHINCQGTSLCKELCPLAKTIVDGSHRDEEIYLHHKQGHRVPVSVRITPLLDKDGQIIGGIELFTDISHREVTELRLRELQQLALIDHLTQLANRAYLERELDSRLEEKKRMQVPLAIMFIDIDHFKLVNDNYGHDIGDRVLKMVANTLNSNARPFDLYGRWGGEEFLGLVRNIDQKALFSIAERLRILIAGSFLSDFDQPLNVTVSIGATLAADDDNLGTLLKRADQMLYRSKDNGRNQVSIAPDPGNN